MCVCKIEVADQPFQNEKTYTLYYVNATDGTHQSSGGYVTHVFNRSPKKTSILTLQFACPIRPRLALMPAPPALSPPGDLGHSGPQAIAARPAPGALYLPRRQDAGRRGLRSCHPSPPLSLSGSADWGPLCFQQVPWSRRS